jgi:hypothetical protein
MMLKHILQSILFFGTFFAAGAPAVGGGGADSGAGAGTSGAGVSGSGQGPAGAGGADRGAGSGQPGAGAGTGQPGAQSQTDQGLKQLREAYEGVKAKFEPYEKLNLKPEQITQYSGVYQKVFGEAQAVGRELGFSDEEIAEALHEDPLLTIQFLRSEAAKAQQNRQQPGQGQDLNELVRTQVEEALGPIQQRENVRMTDQANALFEQTARQLAVEMFKGEGVEAGAIPADEMNPLMTATSEILKYDQGALRALKYEGKTAAIQKAFQEARTFFDKYYLSRSTRERSKLQPARPGQQQQPGQQPGKKPTLDEIINDPGVINQKYA